MESRYTIGECTQRLRLEESDWRIVKALISRNKMDSTRFGRGIRVSEKNVTRMLNEFSRKETYDEIISKLMNLKALLQRHKLQIPFFLKGMIGECLTMRELLAQEHLKDSVILYLGITVLRNHYAERGHYRGR